MSCTVSPGSLLSFLFLLFSDRQSGFKTTTRMGRRTTRRPRRAQTPGPMRRSPEPVGSASVGEDPLDADTDPNLYRYSEFTVPVRGSYTPAPTNPGIPSVTTGTTVGTALPPSNRLHPASRQRSSQDSSELTYVTDHPVIPSPPPGFVPYPNQDPAHRQNPFPTPRAPFQQSPFHPAPVPPPPQMQHHSDLRASHESQSG